MIATTPMLPDLYAPPRLHALSVCGGDDKALARSLVAELVRAAEAGLVTPAMLTDAATDLLNAAQDAATAMKRAGKTCPCCLGYNTWEHEIAGHVWYSCGDCGENWS